MHYIKVEWLHNSPNDPILLYSELDDARLEIRKVEIFPDGSIGFAGCGSTHLDTRLGEVPIPSIEEIASDKQFTPKSISAAEFELVWQNRIK